MRQARPAEREARRTKYAPRGQFFVLPSTDPSLSAARIVTLYTGRWCIGSIQPGQSAA
jgi:hypothetical protein